jgi:hypothetical protein
MHGVSEEMMWAVIAFVGILLFIYGVVQFFRNKWKHGSVMSIAGFIVFIVGLVVAGSSAPSSSISTHASADHSKEVIGNAGFSASTVSDPFKNANAQWLSTVEPNLRPVQNDWSSLLAEAQSWEQGKSLADPTLYMIKLETDAKTAIANLSSGTPGSETALQTITSKLQSLVSEDEKLQNDLMKHHSGIPLQTSSVENEINHVIDSMMSDMSTLNAYAMETQADWLKDS